MENLTLLWRHDDEQKALICVLGDHKATIESGFIGAFESDGFIATINNPMGRVARSSRMDFFELLDWAEGKLIELSE